MTPKGYRKLMFFNLSFLLVWLIFAQSCMKMRISDGKAKKEQSAPASPVVINLQNNNTNQQKQGGGTNTIIKEKTIIEKQAPAEKPADKPAKKSQTEDSPW
jgi:hypothetical protein